MLISTSSAAIKGLRPPAGVPHVCYCHSPARYLWDMQDEYGATAPEGLRGRLRGIGLRVLGPSLRRWDARTAGVLRVTTFLANSTCTQERIARCYRRESTIVFPPVRTGFFTPDASVAREDFWLVAGAIEPYKRTDLAIHAAALTRQRVIVVGDGSQRAVMERLARERGGPIEFMGRVDDDALRGFYRRARGLLFPQIEDFGITACEAQACGTPVVARRAGGALDTVIDGVTGAMFDHPTAESMAEAMGRCPETRAACRKKAEQFSAERFSAGLNEMILRLSR
jgi:glycosyltransferase involved in cell wall biosynthesis